MNYDEPLRCLACGHPLDEDDESVVSLDGETPHLCGTCWESLDVPTKLEMRRKWQDSRAIRQALLAFIDLAQSNTRNLFPGDN